MRAAVFTRYGSPDVLEVCDVPNPVPSDGEVLVRVHAVSLNDWDLASLKGSPFVARMMIGVFSPQKRILGSDVAGSVEAVGKGVTRFRRGDDVFGDLSGRWGGLAEYVCAEEKMLAPKPSRMSFEQAAAIPQAGLLALQSVFEKCELRAGQRLLVNGGGGGVGTFAIQIAKQLGVEITAVDRGDKLDLMRGLGAAHVIDYTKEDFTRNGIAYDRILDVKTRRSLIDLARALAPGGVYVTVGGDMARLAQMLAVRPWFAWTGKKRMRLLALRLNDGLDRMCELFESGRVIPVIDGPYDLTAVPDAFRRLDAGSQQGKIVIRIR